MIKVSFSIVVDKATIMWDRGTIKCHKKVWRPRSCGWDGGYHMVSWHMLGVIHVCGLMYGGVFWFVVWICFSNKRFLTVDGDFKI